MCVVGLHAQGVKYTTSVHSNNTDNDNDNITMLAIPAWWYAFRHIRGREFEELN